MAVANPAVRLGNRAGHEDFGGDTGGANGLAESDANAVAGGELADHVMAEHLRRRDIAHGSVGQSTVCFIDLILRHADAVVTNRKQVAVADVGANDHDAAGRRREVGSVLHQLGEQVSQVGHAGALHLGRIETGKVDAAVRLDLGQRRPNDVGDRHRFRPHARRLRTSKHQQRLGVAAHASGEMIEAEQVGQRLGVALVLLKLGNEGERSSQQPLVTAAQVDQALGNATTVAGLINGHADRGVLHDIECFGQLAELVVTGDGERRGLHEFGTGLHRVDGGHEGGDLLVRSPIGLLGQCFHRFEQAAHHAATADDGTSQSEERQAEQTDQPLPGGVLGRVLLRLQFIIDGVGQRADGTIMGAAEFIHLGNGIARLCRGGRREVRHQFGIDLSDQRGAGTDDFGNERGKQLVGGDRFRPQQPLLREVRFSLRQRCQQRVLGGCRRGRRIGTDKLRQVGLIG